MTTTTEQQEFDKKYQAALKIIKDALTAFGLNLQMGHLPFFHCLFLNLRLIFTTELPTLATDGINLLINPIFVEKQCTVNGNIVNRNAIPLFMHELLHVALQHNSRRAGRDPKIWNYVADCIVNHMVENVINKSQLPQFFLESAITFDNFFPAEIHKKYPDLKNLSVEELYMIAESNRKKLNMDKTPSFGNSPPKKRKGDKQNQGENGEHDHKQCGCFTPSQENSSDKLKEEIKKATGNKSQKELQDELKVAIQQATAAARMREHSGLKGNDARFVDFISNRPEIDWRTILWKFLTPAPTDFGSFDRRFFSQGLYIEELKSDRVVISVCVDTSGSIDHKELGSFIAEIKGMLFAFPEVIVNLYYADAGIFGPYKLDAGSEIPKAQGGGGTDFRPFFKKIEEDKTNEDMNGMRLAVYLTDGFGTFPEIKDIPQELQTLWVITAGGLEESKFPFGSTVRKID